MSVDYLMKISFLLVTLTLSVQAANPPFPSQHIEFHHFRGQDIDSNRPAIRKANTTNASVCALLCSKDDTCLAVSFNVRNESCSLSSAYPELASNDVAADVFVKVEEKLEFIAGAVFIQQDGITLTTQLEIDLHLSFEDCANTCYANIGCYGFQYIPTDAGCGFLRRMQESIVSEAQQNSKIIAYRIVRNLAEGKTAFQSTDLSTHHTANFGNDGNHISYSSTLSETFPYWMVDLGKSCDVLTIKIFNSEYVQRFPIYNPWVYVRGEGDSNATMCGSLTGHVTSESMNFYCPTSLTARYVYIDSYDGGAEHYLHLAEIEVYGYC